MSNNKNNISSYSFNKSLNSPNIVRTPCRRMGLKRKSIGTQIHMDILKKSKVENEIKVVESLMTSNVEASDSKSILKLNYTNGITQKNILDKQQKIEELKSELKNSKQHNLNQIHELSNKWIGVCQEALKSLLNQLNQKQNSNFQSIEDLIKNFGIDPDLIHFDSYNQEFY